MFKMPMLGTIQCPDCARIPCDVYIPRSDETDLIDGTNRWTVYECQSCHATWSLADRWGDLDPPAPPTPALCARVCTAEDMEMGMDPDPNEPKGT